MYLDVLKPVSLNLPVVRCRKDIQGGPSGFWKRKQKLFLILRSAVRLSLIHIYDRDINAAKNILTEGLRQIA